MLICLTGWRVKSLPLHTKNDLLLWAVYRPSISFLPILCCCLATSFLFCNTSHHVFIVLGFDFVCVHACLTLASFYFPGAGKGAFFIPQDR